MRVLLINPPMQVYSEPRFPSFGVAYIAQQLKAHGHTIELLDIDANRFPRQEVSSFIRNSRADIIGIGGLVTVYPYLDWLVPEIKKWRPKTEIILGGPVASSLKERCFERFAIDYEVIGEGEITIVELLNELTSDRNLHRVKGISFRSEGKIVFTEDRLLMPSLDSVPIFDDTLFPMRKLLENAKGVFQIHVQRGCPHSCTFCFNAFRVVGKNVRYRPAGNVIKEIEILKAKYRDEIKLFALAGECITANKEWVINFCKEIMNRNLNIRYRVTSRVDTIDEELLLWLAESGCTNMSLGLESGSDRILKIMQKNTNAEQGKRVVLIAKRYIKNLEISFMLGYIGEDKDTLKDTVNLAKEIGVKPLLFYTTAFPGTRLYKIAVERCRIIDEEQYMMGLDRLSISKFSLNLTDMPNEEAKNKIDSSIKEIERYYLWKDIKSLEVCKRVVSKLKRDGFWKSYHATLKRIKNLYNKPHVN